MTRACLGCGYQTDSTAEIDTEHGDHTRRGPRDGDVSLCLSCGAVQLFDGDGFTWPSKTQLASIMTQREVILAVGHIRRRGPIR